MGVLAFAGCGGDDAGSTYGGGGSSGDQSSGSSGQSSGGDFGGGGSSGVNVLPLAIDPPTAKLSVMALGGRITQPFTLKEGTGASAREVTGGTWTLDTYEPGTVAQTGVFTTSGRVGGKVKLQVKRGGAVATADIEVSLAVTSDIDSPTPANKTALQGAPVADPGGANATKIVYPLNGTVMPKGLTPPVLQFSPGSIAPQDAKVTLSCPPKFSWEGFVKVTNAGVPQVTIPDDVWDAATRSCAGGDMNVTVVKASGGIAYGPASVKMTIANAYLPGQVFYQSYSPNVGVYVVRPGTKAPARRLIDKCVVCHSAAANGSILTMGEDGAGPDSGVYKFDAAGNITQIAKTPAFGGDSRGLSFSAVTPDGKYILRSQSNFWGGLDQRAFIVATAGSPTTVMSEATVTGLTGISAFVPTFSPDGKKFAFINGDTGSSAQGNARRSVGVMDVATNATTNTLAFSNLTNVADNGAAGNITKFPAFLPDSKSIVVQEGSNGENGFGGMLPHYSANTGKMFLIRGSEHLELGNTNRGLDPAQDNWNYEPTALPIPAGGYFWVVFTSRRTYGNSSTSRKQLWVSAISPTSAAGVDPSHPAFYLPNQTLSSGNERGFWSLDACKPAASECKSGDECCDGFCRPENDADPSSKLVCKKPPAGECSRNGEKCMQTSDCCDAAAGTTCTGGFCSPPTPK
jgi:hypothetical protein